ncbi:copper resistance protein CopC [Georgenia ruanii]|uniref:Copper resistance protein CopC n=1 Tax=Georgenia ruanii TaxID=348442 RepID=A0A7J9UY83_9MICO|nr:copper resistance protein CopC [Georgenia ruanii]
MVGLLLVLVAAPARAHDVLLSASPEDGAHLTSAPPTVTLTFNNDVLDINPAIVVRDAAGQPLTDAKPAVTGHTVSLALPSEVPNGGYQVTWRVVSSDGHPIEGHFAFTVDVPAAPAPAPSTSAPSATAEASPSATAAQSPSTGASTGAAGPVVWGVVVLVVLVAAAVVAVVRRRRRAGQ